VTRVSGDSARGRAALAAVVVALALGAGAASAPADVVLGSATCSPASGSLSGCAGVSAYGDALLWTSFDPASRLYRLVAVRSSGAPPAVLPTAGRPVPFEADLGPDASGRPVAVYSRCAGEVGGPPKGCGLYRTDLATGRETRVLAGVTAPAPLPASIWRDRIAYSGPRAADGLRHPTVCTLTGGRRSCRALPAGPAGGRPRAPTTGPQRLDLRGRSLVFSWYSNPGREALIRQTRILLVADVTRPGRAGRQIARAGAGGAGNAAVFSPVLDAGAAYYARGGATCDYGSTPNTFGRYDLEARTARELPSPRIHGLARSASTFVYEACPSFAGSMMPTGTTVVRAEPDPFAGAPAPLRPRACPARVTHGAGWLAPVTLSARGANPALAVGSAGDVAVAGGGRDGVRVRVRRAGRRSFGAPTLLRAVNAGSVQVAVDGAGRVMVAWETSPPGGGAASLIQAAVSDVRGRFGAPQTLRTITGPEAPSAHGVALAVNRAGDAVVVWSLRTSIEASSRTAGSPFGSPTAVWGSAPGTFESSYGHALGIDDGGGALLAWPVMRATQTAVQWSSAPAGAPFGPPAPLAATGVSPRPVAVAVDPDGSAIVAWTQREGRFLRAMVARRDRAGAFAATTAVSPPQAPVASVTPAVAAAGGRAIAAWVEQAQGAARVGVALLDAAGVARRQALTAYRGSAAAVEAALDARGDAAVAWDLRCGRAGRRVMAAMGRATRALAAPQVASGPDTWVQMAGSSLLGIAPSGRAALVWDGMSGRRLVTRFAQTGP
jgi:hypothetical protein